MQLVIFDIDGTLTETMTLDEDCLVRCLEEQFGFRDIDTDWSRYRHATDSGIFQEIFASRTGESPEAAEIARFRAHFVKLLNEAIPRCPCRPVAGACQMLERLAQSDRYRIGLATGGWRDSARVKMASAGMCFDAYPSATADDAVERESILRLALERAVARFAVAFDGAVYVGDGIWDARACRAVGMPFLGIGAGSLADNLLAEGAVCVLPEFPEGDAFLGYVDRALRANSSGPQW